MCVSTATVQYLLFADDCDLNTVRKEDMQRSMDLIKADCAKLDKQSEHPKWLSCTSHHPAWNTMLYETILTGGHERRFKDTLKKSLKQLRINPATWADIALDKTALRRPLKTGVAIYEANRITAAKAKRETRNLAGHRRTQSTRNPLIPTFTANHAITFSDSPKLTPGINSLNPTIIETTSLFSSPVTPTATTTAVVFTTKTAIRDGDSLLYCPQCNRRFFSRIGMVFHLRIHLRNVETPKQSENPMVFKALNEYLRINSKIVEAKMRSRLSETFIWGKAYPNSY
ncbi:unnamed protein product [Schistocephalus solidus]|uniref:C2H2-type domain-containing protein n=1 Tax=Schistocephalus solidus TaxID=70667 RepID=A0A183TK45_SCHSO|nr:unnamed protein product [Schistocephalus solidus]